ncbi:MAG: hypothetical protein ACYDEJ_15235 [Desulfitobacteriaceae bacterium]
MKESQKGVKITQRKFIRLTCLVGIGLSSLSLAACSSKDLSPKSDFSGQVIPQEPS